MNVYNFCDFSPLFTVRCYEERSIVVTKSFIRLFVHDVEVPWSNRLEILENNFMVS